MASRHSRLALKGNTYTQIGLKVWYVGEEWLAAAAAAAAAVAAAAAAVRDRGRTGKRRFRLRQGGEEERTRRRRRRYAARRCVRFVHVHARAHASAREGAHTRNRADPPPGHLHKVIHWRSRSAVCSTITHSRITAETLDTPRHESSAADIVSEPDRF